jgi:hypothetical protein
MSNGVKIKFAFLCDDSRREDNGKLIFIGVYGGSINVHQLPSNLMLCMAIWFEAEERYEGEAEFRMFFDDELIGSGKGIAIVEPPMSISAVQPIPVTVVRDGNLKLEMKLPGGEWQTALTTPIIYKPPTVSTVSQQRA